MNEKKLNESFEIPVEELEEKLGLSINGSFSGYDTIVPLKSLECIKEITYFTDDLFKSLIRKIPLRRTSGEEIYPYANAHIHNFGVEPKGLMVGQKFVLENKLLDFMSKFPKKFSGFVTKGISKMPPVKIYGRDSEEKKVLAFYMLPIIEIHKDIPILLDGIHRNYLCGAAGTTTNTIHIYNVKEELPFKPISWKEIKLVKEKPPINERYVDLKKEFFRDLSAVGIDG